MKILYLIALFTFCAGSISISPAQNFYSISDNGSSGYINTDDDPGSVNNTGFTKKGNTSRKTVKNRTGDRIDLLLPAVPDNNPVFISKLKPLPSYLGFDGLYKIDCVWVNKHEYFRVWETNKLNPYNFNGLDLKDSVRLNLFSLKDSVRWHSPLGKTIVTSDFGLRRAAWHYGIDFRVSVGAPVYAAFDGVVRITGYDRYGFGRFVVLRHSNGLETIYGHLRHRNVQLGQEVRSGDIIGTGGNSGRSTGPHLHFELRYIGNAIDPNVVFDFRENKIRFPELIINPGSFAYLEEANKIRHHVVRRGDTLSEIGYRYGVPVTKLCRLNHIRRNTIIHIGQRIRIN